MIYWDLGVDAVLCIHTGACSVSNGALFHDVGEMDSMLADLLKVATFCYVRDSWTEESCTREVRVFGFLFLNWFGMSSIEGSILKDQSVTKSIMKAI